MVLVVFVGKYAGFVQFRFHYTAVFQIIGNGFYGNQSFFIAIAYIERYLYIGNGIAAF